MSLILRRSVNGGNRIVLPTRGVLHIDADPCANPHKNVRSASKLYAILLPGSGAAASQNRIIRLLTRLIGGKGDIRNNLMATQFHRESRETDS